MVSQVVKDNRLLICRELFPSLVRIQHHQHRTKTNPAVMEEGLGRLLCQRHKNIHNCDLIIKR